MVWPTASQAKDSGFKGLAPLSFSKFMCKITFEIELETLILDHEPKFTLYVKKKQIYFQITGKYLSIHQIVTHVQFKHFVFVNEYD